MEPQLFISALKQCYEQSIVFHHQTDSYSAHKALNNFYDELLGLLDGLIESAQGIYPIMKGYSLQSPVDYVDVDTTIKYFQDLYAYIQEHRTMVFPESWLQNQIDEIAQLVAETIYQLRLK